MLAARLARSASLAVYQPRLAPAPQVAQNPKKAPNPADGHG